MANMDSYLSAFIAENELDESLKEKLIELINRSFGDYVAHLSKDWYSTDTPVSNGKNDKTGSIKANKADRLDNPLDAESQDDLRRCTSVVLNEFCKNQDLKQGGNKKNLIERVWRYVQGDTSDEDKKARTKSKKSESKNEKIQCFACNSKGVPCGTGASEEHNGKWFCWRHISEAESIIASKESHTPENTESEHEDDVPIEQPKAIKKSSKKKSKELEESD
jgi:hypothetical protein